MQDERSNTLFFNFFTLFSYSLILLITFLFLPFDHISETDKYTHQADLLGIDVVRPSMVETTALGSLIYLVLVS